MRFARVAVVIIVGAWMLGTLPPELSCIATACPDNGLSVNYDGVVTDAEDGSPAAKAGLVPGDRAAVPIPHDLYRDPPVPITFAIVRNGVRRTVHVGTELSTWDTTDKVRLAVLTASYLVFLLVGSAVLLLRPSAMTWTFYGYCVLHRFGDLGFYWPGSGAFYWTNYIALATLGGALCGLVTMFALLFPNDRIDAWRRPLYAMAIALTLAFPLAWAALFVRLGAWGLPSEAFFNRLVFLTSVVYAGAAAIFIATLVTSSGDERHRLRWILVFPLVLILRVVAIEMPHYLPEWYWVVPTALGVCVPLAVAYAIVRRRVFDIEFAISRALIYGALTSIIAGSFLLIDWFMSEQFSQSKLTLTAEIVVALALGSSLNMLHRNVDRFVDGTFFRKRHAAERRIEKAAAAILRAESHDVVDRFLAHEPVEAFELTSAVLYHRDASGEATFRREAPVGSGAIAARELTHDDPLVLHLLAEGEPVRLADVAWTSQELPAAGNAVLAMPVLLRDELMTIALYGPHRTGADIDPDEVRSLSRLVANAGAAYDHIEARALREEVARLKRELDAMRV
ncbi:MAG: hypothetical protein JO175_05680 [Candidatus Eremiobacteraeota bacterium]|nr:hypothetical protein [Candidatus Eremiobacteraeota bacterium]